MSLVQAQCGSVGIKTCVTAWFGKECKEVTPETAPVRARGSGFINIGNHKTHTTENRLGASAPHKDVPSHLSRFPPYIAALNLILHVIGSLLSLELRGSHSEAATLRQPLLSEPRPTGASLLEPTSSCSVLAITAWLNNRMQRECI